MYNDRNDKSLFHKVSHDSSSACKVIIKKLDQLSCSKSSYNMDLLKTAVPEEVNIKLSVQQYLQSNKAKYHNRQMLVVTGLSHGP